MTTAYKVLGQEIPAANVLTTLYTAPAGKQAVCSTLTICNQGATFTQYSVAVRPAGAAIASKHYIAYSADIAPKETVFLSLGITLAATDVVSVKAGTAEVSFGLFGSEIAP